LWREELKRKSSFGVPSRVQFQSLLAASMNFESLKPARPGPITPLFSLWVSFVFPRQVVKPLINLREAVDHADLGTSKHVGRASLRKSSLCCGSARSMSSGKE
jgi:hypothetical protein